MFKNMRKIEPINTKRKVITVDIKNVESIKDEFSGFEGSFVVGWYQDKLLFDMFDKDLSFYINENLINLRVFDKDKEVFIYKTKNSYKLRKIKDGDGEEMMYFDANQIMWGTNAIELEHCIEVFEERGMRFCFPNSMDYLLALKENKHMLVLKTRNYVGFLGNHQASIEDVRFLGFEVKPLEE